MKKRGISAIVATVLIILITIAAVGVVWGMIIPMIQEGTSFEEGDVSLVIDEASGYTYYDADKMVACVQVRRGDDEFNLSRIDVFFGFNGTSYISNFSGDDIPGPNEARKKCFNLVDYGAPESVKVSPIIWRGNKEVVGSITSDISGIKSGTYPESEVDPADLDRPVKSINYRRGISRGCDAGEVWEGGECVASGGCVGGCASPSSELVCNIDNTKVVENITTPTCEGSSCVDVYSSAVVEDCGDGSCLAGYCVPFGMIGIAECPMVLDQLDGEYLLVKNLESSGSCLTVGSNGVAVDFNGFNILGDGSGNGIYAHGRDWLTVKDGSITSFGNGMLLSQGDNGRISDMVLTGNSADGIYLANGMYNTLTDINSSYNTGVTSDGIYLKKSDYNNLTRVTANFNGHYGISFKGASNHNTEGNQVIDSVACRNEKVDIYCGPNFNEGSHSGSGNKFSTKMSHCGDWLYDGSMSCAVDIGISDCQGLQDMRNELYANYYLESDIDCAGFDFGDGKGFMPVGDESDPFIGGFDGRHNSIDNLSINRPDRDDVGLFGYANLKENIRFMYRVQFKDVYLVGRDNVGAFAGTIDGTNPKYVVEVSVSGNVNGNNNIGGLFGYVKKGYLADSYSSAVVDGNNYVGGLVGYTLDSMTIKTSYSIANVSGNGYVGGIAGGLQVGATAVYSVAFVYGNSNVYGISDTPYASESYWYNVAGDDADECETYDGCTEETDSSVFFSSSHPVYDGRYSTWDFNNVWEYPNGNDYPKIRGFS